ncbi:hypothetical protein [Methanoplanus endosymbiosus]|uniref:Uncharacterized protein n=1 Tax=Methanoplanus endosymbiosus TaxID=33865 RepID=A0A9E7PQV3_9EURY|nr:hypothetical protein [Methanoplanus endosymbiosus]UUX93266.1 hypothetical protein L6E24_03835 [Methanoplanus endosymbiosus]
MTNILEIKKELNELQNKMKVLCKPLHAPWFEEYVSLKEEGRNFSEVDKAAELLKSGISITGIEFVKIDEQTCFFEERMFETVASQTNCYAATVKYPDGTCKNHPANVWFEKRYDPQDRSDDSEILLTIRLSRTVESKQQPTP